MQYRPLGATDLKVSLICLGTMTWGQQNTAEDGFAQMDYALDKGVNFFDTAELYAIPPSADTYGRTEEIIGDWFARTKKRKDVVLATKVAGPAPQLPWIRGGKAELSYAQIIAACDESLRRLRTDYIDLYQVHWPQRPVNSFGKLGYAEQQVTGHESGQIRETLRALQVLVETGKVRYIGLSNETPWGVMTYLDYHVDEDYPRIVSIQNPYNLLNRTFEIGLAEMSMQESIGLLAYAPLAAGTLTGKYLGGRVPKGSRRDIDPRGSRYDRPNTDAAVNRYLDIATRHGLDPAQMAIAFINRQPFVTSTIIGATGMEQLASNIAAVNVALPDAVLREIDAVHALIPNPCP